MVFYFKGDFEYKSVEGKGPTEQLVSPEPEFFIKPILPEQDEFLVLACDGEKKQFGAFLYFSEFLHI